MSSIQPSLAAYYASFKSVLGALAIAVSAVPLLAKALPGPDEGYGFPPLGGVEVPARIGACAIGLAATYFAFFSGAAGDQTNRKRIVWAIVCTAISLFVYVGLFSRLVRRVEIPSKGTSVQVTVGFRRSAAAVANFDGESDWDMLRNRGTDDEQVEWLWTRRSVLIARLSLYIAYSLFIFSIVAAFSWGVLEDLSKRSTGTADRLLRQSP